MNHLSRLRRVLRFALCCVCWSALFGCADPDARTKITFRLSAPDALKPQIATLVVKIVSDRVNSEETFAADELKWSVEIVVIPKGDNRTTRKVDLIATAFDRERHPLAEWRGTKMFVPKEQTDENIAAVLTGTGPNSELDAGAGDAGLDARTDDRDGSQGRDATGPGGDANPAVVNCETASSTIRCDDGNACNGTELCQPSNARADERGCTQGEDMVSCMSDSTCDTDTGKCSTCLVKADGDDDGARSTACMGNDCNDSDDKVAPGKVELCDGKDNDCDGKVDGLAANGDCTSMAPRNGSASCENGRCLPRCDDTSFTVANGVCVATSGTCPIINPCAPGSCVGGRGTYSCTCPAGFRTGLTRCAPSGVKRKLLGFETSCDGTPTPGSFAMGVKQVSSSLYAACGVASIKSSGLLGQARLFEPGMAVIDGITGTTALIGTSAETSLASELTIGFSPAVNEVTLDVADLDNATGLRAVFEAADTTVLLDAHPQPATGSKRARVTHSSRIPIDHVTLSYTRLSAADEWYVDELAFDIWGCGDGEVETGETCDDGNAVQCDGCDNGCSASTAGCLAGNACIADGTMDGCVICNATARADAGVDIAPRRDPLAGVGCPP